METETKERLYPPRWALIAAREEKGMTQTELADALSLTRVFVSHVECGQRNARIEIMTRWADYFGLSLDAFRNAA